MKSWRAQDYLKHLISIYHSAQLLSKSNTEEIHYRIVKMPDDMDKTIHFQVKGKCIVLKLLPEKIMRDDLLLGFSRSEIALITHYGTKNEIQPLIKSNNNFFKLLKQVFAKGRTYFWVQKNNGEVVEYEANALYNDLEQVKNFNGLDGMKIGYTAAEEHYTRLAKLKKTDTSAITKGNCRSNLS